jgi:hypothetical protein
MLLFLPGFPIRVFFRTQPDRMPTDSVIPRTMLNQPGGKHIAHVKLQQYSVFLFPGHGRRSR